MHLKTIQSLPVRNGYAHALEIIRPQMVGRGNIVVADDLMQLSQQKARLILVEIGKISFAQLCDYYIEKHIKIIVF